VAETARILGVSRTTVYLALADGRLSGEKVGGSWRVDPRSVDEWIERETSLFDRAAAAIRRLRLPSRVAAVLAFVSPSAVGRAFSTVRRAPGRFGGGAVTGRRAYAVGIAAAVVGAAIVTLLTLSGGDQLEQRGGSAGSSSGPVHVVSGGDETTAAAKNSGNPDGRSLYAQSRAKPGRSRDVAASGGGASDAPTGGSGGEVSAPSPSEPAPSNPTPAPEGKPPPTGESPSPAPSAPSAPPSQPPVPAGGTDPAASPPPPSDTGVQPADGSTGGVDTGVGG
jgi:excisionase family DNA binding protein